ncbi:MAG: acetolactate synthase small subunit [Planctomycetaceae bacterium]
MRHVLSALVMNQPGVLAHISGMLASRAYNIDSLAVGETENPELSRMTFVVSGDNRTLDQVRKQLEKIVTVVRVLDDYSGLEFVGLRPDVDQGAVRRPKTFRSEGIDGDRGRIVDVSA